MVEDTYTSEWLPLILIICIVNASNPMWDALIQRTHLKSHTDLIHALNGCIFVVIFIRMDHLVLMILFELVIVLLKRLEVVVEWEHRVKVLVTLILGFDLALFYFFFEALTNKGASTESIDRLNSFEVRDLRVDLEEGALKR